MEKKKNVFSKLLNRVKKVWQELGTPDIETGEDILTQSQREELTQIERIGDEVHKNGFAVGKIKISEAKAKVAAAEKANSRKKTSIQKELGNA